MPCKVGVQPTPNPAVYSQSTAALFSAIDADMAANSAQAAAFSTKTHRNITVAGQSHRAFPFAQQPQQYRPNGPHHAASQGPTVQCTAQAAASTAPSAKLIVQQHVVLHVGTNSTTQCHLEAEHASLQRAQVQQDCDDGCVPTGVAQHGSRAGRQACVPRLASKLGSDSSDSAVQALHAQQHSLSFTGSLTAYQDTLCNTQQRQYSVVRNDSIATQTEIPPLNGGHCNSQQDMQQGPQGATTFLVLFRTHSSTHQRRLPSASCWVTLKQQTPPQVQSTLAMGCLGLQVSPDLNFCQLLLRCNC